MEMNKDHQVTAQEVSPVQSDRKDPTEVSELPASPTGNEQTTRGSRYQFGRTLFGYVKTKQFWLVLLFGYVAKKNINVSY